jgi:mannosyltransferase OCH1-like enzyme
MMSLMNDNNSSVDYIKNNLKNKQNLIRLQLMRIQHYKASKKHEYNSIIPLKIYQTWHTKNLPAKMKESVEKIKKRHPKFEHFLFDDDDCRNFIKDNFDSPVLNAFDRLVPGAYKADLWRYCILYKYGGIYLDIKYDCINSFRFIELTEKEHWVFDINGTDIYNALICVAPKNEILLKCIFQIIYNVNHNYYGNSCIDPTGPGLVGKFMTDIQRRKIELTHIWNRPTGDKFILYKNVSILKMYKGYYDEHESNKKVEHYASLWSQRRIYN